MPLPACAQEQKPKRKLFGFKARSLVAEWTSGNGLLLKLTLIADVSFRTEQTGTKFNNTSFRLIHAGLIYAYGHASVKEPSVQQFLSRAGSLVGHSRGFRRTI
jgi:hypothetical protein